RLLVNILVGSQINLKEQISFVDNVSFLKGNVDNVAADSRRDGDQVDRRGSAGEFAPVHDLLLLRFADRDLRRGKTMRRRRLVVACGQTKTHGENYQPRGPGGWSTTPRALVLRPPP